MKKVSLVLSIVLILMLALTACGSKTADETPTPEVSKTYKETMIPFDQIVPGERIVLLQNSLNYSMDGFYTAETKPVTTEIKYDGKAVNAYAITYTLDFLKNDIAGDVTVTDTDSKTATFTAEDFAGMYVIIDFASDAAPVLYNPETKSEVKAFAYAATAEGEGIYSIVADSSHKAADIATALAWDTTQTFRLVATDKFYIPVCFSENPEGELRGTLSGAINASFPGLTIASGKINDVVYIEKIVEQ